MPARARFGLAAALAGIHGVCYPLIKVGLAYAPPLAFAALRALDERPSVVEWIGAAVVLSSLGTVAREGRRTEEA